MPNPIISANALFDLVMVSPQINTGMRPQFKNGDQEELGQSVLFHYEGNQSMDLQSDITDNFVEDNTSISDHIALRPEKFTTTGYIGELNNVAPAALELVRDTAERLQIIPGLLPQLTVAGLTAYNNALAAYQAASNISNNSIPAWRSVGATQSGFEKDSFLSSVVDGDSSSSRLFEQNKQQIAFQQFYAYWRNRTLFTVQTPWAIFRNMALENVRAIQSQDTRVITDFEITFKVIRFVSTYKIDVQRVVPGNSSGRAKAASSNLSDRGSQKPSTLVKNQWEQ